jgi:hypothetical protein
MKKLKQAEAELIKKIEMLNFEISKKDKELFQTTAKK